MICPLNLFCQGYKMRDILIEEIQNFLLDVEDGEECCFHNHLEIDTICDIPVNSYLKMNLTFQEDGNESFVAIDTQLVIFLRSPISTDRILFEYDLADSEEVDEEALVQKCIQQVGNIIRVLKDITFDTYLGVFVESTHTSKKFNQYINKELLECPKIKFVGSQCCVCYEDTITQTTCKHFVCISCICQLQDARCPICREAFELDPDK